MLLRMKSGLALAGCVAGQERFPRLVAWILERNGNSWIGMWPRRCRKQLHVGLQGRAATFSAVAIQTRANNILPSGFPALRSRNHMVQAELAHGSRLTAILTMISIACEKCFTIEPHRGLWNSIV